MAMREKERAANGIVWTREHHSRDDWPRAWKRIEPLLADCDPKTVTPEMLQELRTDISEQVSETEAHRTIKVWRALWGKVAVLGFCEAARDPSFLFANSAPKPRQDLWFEGEASRLVKKAWRSGYKGMAVLLAVAWDSQLSPVDARNLRVGDMRRDPIGIWFDVARAKTGREAIATLSPRTERLLQAYLASLPAAPMAAVKIFCNRSGRPYTKDTLGDDFREIRAKVFGDQERRQLADFRRSGATEALAGNVPPEKLSKKMANTLSASNRLHQTYAPVQLASVRDVDAARKVGRAKLREQKPDESIRSPARKYPVPKSGGAK
jgi:integrase